MKRINLSLLTIMAPAILFAGCNTYTDEGAGNPRVYGGTGPQIQNVNEEYRSASYNQTYRMKVEDDLEDQVVKLQDVQSAAVISIQRQAYVAVVLEDGNTDSVPEDIYDQITSQIKSADEAISDVFVSSNADFVVEMANYREQLQSRKPIPGIAEEFNDTIERTFPAINR
ncbi:YhcN/YlaJ family sporulation lipoprotein [Mesobacillus thioparans]|uniref:YhcN/YlaJ family sporulation lipoprotein n=1 Tax=Mesobacillus thioparans TaxID=370439 RepID=UPI0039F03A29